MPKRGQACSTKHDVTVCAHADTCALHLHDGQLDLPCQTFCKSSQQRQSIAIRWLYFDASEISHGCGQACRSVSEGRDPLPWCSLHHKTSDACERHTWCLCSLALCPVCLCSQLLGVACSWHASQCCHTEDTASVKNVTKRFFIALHLCTYYILYRKG